jgi:DNA-binding NtrC family response regulator
MLYFATRMPVVFIISRDSTLRSLVCAELREANVEARGMQSAQDLAKMLGRGMAPSAVVLDAAELEDSAARDALQNLARHVAVLVVDSRMMPGRVLPGAEVLRRPVRVGDIVARVLARLAGEAA